MIYSNMPYAELKKTDLFKARCEEQLACWIYRENMAGGWAFPMEEAKRIVGCESLMDYLRTQRTGSKFRLTRDQKESLWLLYDNVCNHISIEFCNMKRYDLAG